MKTVTLTVQANPNLDDCLTGAAEAYIEDHPELSGYDLDPRWSDGEDGDRERVTLSVPVSDDVAEAIERSMSFNEIVTIDHDDLIIAELRLVAHDWVRGNDSTEFWSLTPAGLDDWRVHVRH